MYGDVKNNSEDDMHPGSDHTRTEYYYYYHYYYYYYYYYYVQKQGNMYIN